MSDDTFDSAVNMLILQMSASRKCISLTWFQTDRNLWSCATSVIQKYGLVTAETH